MKDINSLVEDVKINNFITLEDIPDIDLYMDQVIQLFENKLGYLKRNEEDKILTKTMINNYSKGNLFMDINYKKHLKMISKNDDDIKEEILNITKELENLNAEEEKLLLLTYLAAKANMYKRLCEKIVDDLF